MEVSSNRATPNFPSSPPFLDVISPIFSLNHPWFSELDPCCPSERVVASCRIFRTGLLWLEFTPYQPLILALIRGSQAALLTLGDHWVDIEVMFLKIVWKVDIISLKRSRIQCQQLPIRLQIHQTYPSNGFSLEHKEFLIVGWPKHLWPLWPFWEPQLELSTIFLRPFFRGYGSRDIAPKYGISSILWQIYRISTIFW